MATRITKRQECDKAMCRNRSGVADVTITIRTLDPETKTWAWERWEGELCPTHLKLAKGQAAAMFQNKKTYDAPEEGGSDE